MFCSWNAEHLPVKYNTICITQCQKKSHLVSWFKQVLFVLLSHKVIQVIFAYDIHIYVFFNSVLSEDQIILENSNCFLGTFNKIVE